MITVDLAISQKETADDTVVMVSGSTDTQQIYVIEYVNGHFTPNQTLDYIFSLADKYDVREVGVEVVAYQKAFIYMLEAEMKRRGKMLRITELKAKASKTERAMGLLPYVEQHKFFISDSHKTLLDQMTTFPFSKHD
jgi:predicted phage terminase large subunit-like protein